ncbi:TetR/AcrR family transcriptional regulator [Leptolyngbya sp. 7M]|uniref:TetR/AcrR family transcriptional regulator n=1 Tax=Leptolyngbya sp. 7M TaxID=2812896 RepID=UPI001B8D0EE2|nr:TetR/AcrR family transcriptional regulator [Leptolyngbya sp. 7M]QYO65649.1 TetR/AcrR family transcriptional regulator [Leptolyngbya sp. 7M]
MSDTAKPSSMRDAILDATDRLLARYGYKKMTIDDLAAEVGIGKGSIYLHFKSKEEIALSHIDRIVTQLKERLRSIAGSPGDCKERVRKMLIERVMFRFDSVQHYTQSLNELLAVIRPKLLEKRRRNFEEEAAIFAAVLSEGKKKGDFSFNDAEETANLLLDSTNALLPYSLSAYELGERSEIELKAAAVADLILNGIRSR